MPLPSRVQAHAVSVPGARPPRRSPRAGWRRWGLACGVAVAIVLSFVGRSGAQGEVTEADLDVASSRRTIRLGAVTSGRVTTIPLETYVARVLAGEGEPRAPEAAQQVLAIAIRTFALANAGRHGAEGFDVCDSTHCQVLRASTANTRRAALATAGRILTYNGRPAEVFYSASCGGATERAADVWPGAELPYLQSVPDGDVHADDRDWTAELSLSDIRQALRRAGFEGSTLRRVEVAARSGSGRVTRLSLAGLQPDTITGDQFRALMGASVVRSTAFTSETRGNALHVTGRGYGHGVGLCVIGAGRRAMRGESVESILSTYFPGLSLTGRAGVAVPVESPAPVVGAAPIVSVPPVVSGVPSSDLQRMASRAHEDLSKVLGVAVAPIVVTLHPSIESFRQATGRPWWVSVVASGTTIDLAPAPILEQRDGLEAAVRLGVAELLVSGPLAQRPAWVRVGAARYFARTVAGQPSAPAAGERRGSSDSRRCPSDAELTLAISAAAQRETEARAEGCFVRALTRARSWREVR